MSEEKAREVLYSMAWILERARQGDERVLAVAREKAEQGNKFAQFVLEEAERSNHVHPDR